MPKVQTRKKARRAAVVEFMDLLENCERPDVALVSALLSTQALSVTGYKYRRLSALTRACTCLTTPERIEVARFLLAHPSTNLADVSNLMYSVVQRSSTAAEVDAFLDLIDHHPQKDKIDIDYTNACKVDNVFRHAFNAKGLLFSKVFLTRNLLEKFCKVFPSADLTRCSARGKNALFILTKQCNNWAVQNASEYLACLRFLLERLPKHSVDYSFLCDTPLTNLIRLCPVVIPHRTEIETAAMEILLQAGANVTDDFNNVEHIKTSWNRHNCFPVITGVATRMFLLLFMHGFPCAKLNSRTIGGEIQAVEVACLLNQPDMLVKWLGLGQRTSVPKLQTTERRLRAVFHVDNLPLSPQVKELLHQRNNLPWSPKRHHLYGPDVRHIVFRILLTTRYQQQQQVPWEIWTLVIDFLCAAYS